jgi:hypothetical protein
LVNGARLLGQLWRQNIRCADGWSDTCGDRQPTKFCKAKRQWLDLLSQDRQEGDYRPLPDFGREAFLLEAMNPDEFEATGMTVEYDIPTVGRVKVGPKGEIPAAMLREEPVTIKAVLQVLETFPDAKVLPPKKSGPYRRPLRLLGGS